MWLSRVFNRGYDRMLRIFCIGPITTDWGRPFSASIGRNENRTASTKLIWREGQQLLLLPREEVCTTSGKHSISRYPIQKTKHG